MHHVGSPAPRVSRAAPPAPAVVDGGWDGPHRVLRNSTLRAWEQQGRPAPGERPGEGDVVARAAGRSGSREYRRYDMTSPSADRTGDVEAMALYAGQSVGLVRDARPAGAVVAALVEEAEAALQRVDAHRGRPSTPSGG